MQRNNYYFLEEDFFIWYRAYKISKEYLNTLYLFSEERKIDENNKIKAARTIESEYKVFISSLNVEERKYLKENVLKRRYFTTDDIRHHPDIFYNWKEIVIDSHKHEVPDFDYLLFGTWLIYHRELNGLSRAKAARYLEINGRVLKSYELGLSKMPSDVLAKLIVVYDIDDFDIRKFLK